MKKIFVGVMVFFCMLINVSLAYTLTVNNFSMDVAPGRQVTTTVSAEKAFINWTYSGITLTPAEQTSKTLSFTMPNQAVMLVANYDEPTLPILATLNGEWYTQGGTLTNGTVVGKDKITSITLKDTYTPGTVLGYWDASKDKVGTVTAYLEDDGMGSGTYKLTIVGDGSGSIIADTGCNLTFYDFSKVTAISGMDILDTSNVTNMSSMFLHCYSLVSVDVSKFDTNKVTSLSSMFCDCYSLVSVDVSKFDTNKVTNMSSMFDNCRSLVSVDVSNFDTNKVTYMVHMFRNCYSLVSVDVSNFDTSKVTNMACMFEECKSLVSIDVSSFDTRSITQNGLSLGLVRFAKGCSGVTEIILGPNFAQSNNIPTVGTSESMFLVSSVLSTTVYGANDVMKAYDWGGDNRTVTFVSTNP